MNILVFIEHVDGKINKASYEALRAAQLISGEINGEVSAVILGQNISGLASEIASKKLKTVYTVDHALLKSYTADGYANAMKQAIEQLKSEIVLMTHTYEARDFAPKLAASFGKLLLGDNIAYKIDGKIDGGKVVYTRQVFQGKLAADVAPAGAPPYFVSFQIGSFRGNECEAGSAEVKSLAVHLDADIVRQQPEERFKEAKAAVDLTAAPLIVAIGRGIKESANLNIIKDLASALGAEIAASRPICDNDWLPMDRQIGSSGQTVAPKLYLAVGISGAIQHIVGMKGSRTIVAINTDKEAPIFEIADYGIVGDLFEIVPALTVEANKLK